MPIEVVRHIAHSAIETWMDIIRNKKGRIQMRMCDIHTIYYEIRPEEMRARMADLNEARVLTEEEEVLSKLIHVEAKILPRNIKSFNLLLKRLHSPGPYTTALYPDYYSD